MMYIAESTSASLRLVASWALSLPALSLCRDRFEQTIRFSYLANQPDDAAWNSFLIDAIRKKNQLGRRIAEEPVTRAYYEKLIGPLKDWELAIPGKAERATLDKWKSLTLDVMARNRDELIKSNPSIATNQPLAALYTSMYAEASSVPHYDFMALMMLHEFRTRDQVILAPDPRSPVLLVLHCAMFDVIQCADCFAGFWKQADVSAFDGLWAEWEKACQAMELPI
jgi:hypothetical protein